MSIKNLVTWLIIYFTCINSVFEQNTVLLDAAESLCSVMENVTPHSKMASSVIKSDLANLLSD